MSQTRRKPLQPLDYMLAIMRDPEAPRRDRMAICAAQYCHCRAAGHPQGKKAARAEAARTAGDGTSWEGLLAWPQQ